MKLVWHIIEKDLRRNAWGLAVYAGTGLFSIFYPSPIQIPGGTANEYLRMVSALCAGVLGSALIVSWIQEDGLVDENAFWRTRPITGRRLLAAKLTALLGIFVVLPVVTVMLVHLTTTGHWVKSWSDTGDQLLLSIAATLVLAAFASCTRDLLRCLVVGVVCSLAGFALTKWLGTYAPPGGRFLPRGLFPTRMYVIIGWCGLIAVGVLYLQYIARRLAVAVGLIAVGVVGSALIGAFWTWNPMR